MNRGNFVNLVSVSSFDGIVLKVLDVSRIGFSEKLPQHFQKIPLITAKMSSNLVALVR